jgi:hypothetical protein
VTDRSLLIPPETFEAAQRVKAARDLCAALREELREADEAYTIACEAYRPLQLAARRMFEEALAAPPSPSSLVPVTPSDDPTDVPPRAA